MSEVTYENAVEAFIEEHRPDPINWSRPEILGVANKAGLHVYGPESANVPEQLREMFEEYKVLAREDKSWLLVAAFDKSYTYPDGTHPYDAVVMGEDDGLEVEWHGNTFNANEDGVLFVANFNHTSTRYWGSSGSYYVVGKGFCYGNGLIDKAVAAGLDISLESREIQFPSKAMRMPIPKIANIVEGEAHPDEYYKEPDIYEGAWLFEGDVPDALVSYLRLFPKHLQAAVVLAMAREVMGQGMVMNGDGLVVMEETDLQAMMDVVRDPASACGESKPEEMVDTDTLAVNITKKYQLFK